MADWIDSVKAQVQWEALDQRTVRGRAEQRIPEKIGDLNGARVLFWTIAFVANNKNLQTQGYTAAPAQAEEHTIFGLTVRLRYWIDSFNQSDTPTVEHYTPADMTAAKGDSLCAEDDRKNIPTETLNGKEQP